MDHGGTPSSLALDCYQKNPKDFDGALKGFTLALKGCAGTRYASSCEKMISRMELGRL